MKHNLGHLSLALGLHSKFDKIVVVQVKPQLVKYVNEFNIRLSNF